MEERAGGGPVTGGCRAAGIVLGVLLIVDGATGGLAAANLAASLTERGVGFGTLLFVHVAVCGLCVTAGGLLLGRRPAALALARLALPTSAVMTTLETGFALVPSNLFPSYRWPIVAIAWIYAIGWVIVIRRCE